MRRARLLALFLDVLVCAVPADLAGLLLTGFIWHFLPALRGGIAAIWVLAGASATAAFLLRDARGGRARRWLDLAARRRDGRAPGPLASVRRNLPLLVPIWNLYDAWPMLRKGDGERRTDRRTGIRIVRTP